MLGMAYRSLSVAWVKEAAREVTQGTYRGDDVSVQRNDEDGKADTQHDQGQWQGARILCWIIFGGWPSCLAQDLPAIFEWPHSRMRFELEL
jgi:hypothetical protein